MLWYNHNFAQQVQRQVSNVAHGPHVFIDEILLDDLITIRQIYDDTINELREFLKKYTQFSKLHFFLLAIIICIMCCCLDA